jgi:benzoylformate decarboxylase
VRGLLDFPPAVDRPRPPARQLPPAIETETGEQISVQLLVQTLARLRPAGSVIVEEAPSTRPVMCEYLPNDEPDSFFTTASGGLGHGMPAAVGRLIGQPDKRVIAVVGDGSTMYAPQALWTAAQLGDIPLTVIVVNNGRYATVHSFARAFGMKGAVGSDLPGLDFATIARGHGCAAATVRRPDELAQALRTALASNSPYLLDVVVSD